MATDISTLGMKVDSTDVKNATSDLDKMAEKAKSTGTEVDKFGKNAEKSMRDAAASGAVLGDAIAGALKFVAEMTKNLFDLGGQLEIMAQKTGASVEWLSKMKYVGEQMDVPFQALGNSFKFMSVNINTAVTQGGEAAEIFRRMGVSAQTLKDQKPEDTFLQIIDRLGQIPNAYERAEAGQKIFGRGFLELAPLIAEGTDKIHELMNEAEDLGITMSASTAHEMKDFGDTINKMENAVKGFFLQAITPLIPALNALAASLISTSKAGNSGWVETFTGALKVAITIVVYLYNRLKEVGLVFGAIGAAAAALANGEFRGAWMAIKEGFADAAANAEASKKTISDLWTGELGKDVTAAAKKIDDLSGALKGNTDSIGILLDRVKGYYPGVIKATDEKNAFIRESEKSALSDVQAMYTLQYITQGQMIAQTAQIQEAADAQLVANAKAKVSAYDAEIAKLKEVADTASRSSKDRETAEKTILTAIEARRVAVNAVALLEAKAADDAKQAAFDQIKYEQLQLEATLKIKQAQLDWGKAIADSTANEQRILGLIGQTPEAIARSNAEYTEQIKLDQQRLVLQKQITDIANGAPGDINAAIDALNALNDSYGPLITHAGDYAVSVVRANDSLDNQRQVFNDLNGITKNFFDDFIENGSSAFKNVGDALKKYILDQLYKLTIQKFVVQITAAITGGTATSVASAAGLFSGANGGSPASTAGGVANTASGIGSIASGLGSLIGVGDSIMGAAASAIGIELASTSASLATLGIAAEAGAAAVGGMGAVAVAAIPVVGWIAAAGMLLYSLFGNKGGAPKAGGFATSTGSTGGLNVDSGNNRYYTPNDADSDIGKIVANQGTTYAQQLTALGGDPTKNKVNFGLGYDIDAGGNANTRLSVGASVNGQSVYDVRNKDEGKGTDTLQTDIALETQRALLAALQASDLQEGVKNILNSVIAATASSDDITKAISRAQAFSQVLTLIDTDPLKAALKGIELGSQTATDAIDAQKTALDALIANYDGSAAASTGLADATKAYYAANVQLLVQLEQVKTSVHNLFGNTVRDLRLQTLDPADKKKFLLNEADTYQAQLANTKDPAQIAALAQKINQDLTDAFNLLTPEQQKLQLDQYTKVFDALDKMINDRLSGIEGGVTSSVGETLVSVRDTLKLTADTITATANTNLTASTNQNDAANTNLQASRNNLAASQTPIKVVVQNDAGNEVNG